MAQKLVSDEINPPESQSSDHSIRIPGDWRYKAGFRDCGVALNWQRLHRRAEVCIGVVVITEVTVLVMI